MVQRSAIQGGGAESHTNPGPESSLQEGMEVSVVLWVPTVHTLQISTLLVFGDQSVRESRIRQAPYTDEDPCQRCLQNRREKQGQCKSRFHRGHIKHHI